MFIDDFILICKEIGVSEIKETGNEYDEGFRVVLKNGKSVYVTFHQQYGDAWLDFETDKEFENRWANCKILSAEETEEFNLRTLEAIKKKYSSPNFEFFLNNFLQSSVTETK